MRKYRIERILEPDRVTPKTDQYSIDRIGRVVELDFPFIQAIVGKQGAVIHYLYDKDGDDLSFRAMATTLVTSLNWNIDKSFIVMRTENSIYEFREVEDS